MSNKNKTVVMEKDGVETEVTREQFKGLVKRGWSVVDTGNKDEEKALKAAAEEQEKLEKQERELFGVPDPEKEN
jgi:hypothetical protein